MGIQRTFRYPHLHLVDFGPGRNITEVTLDFLTRWFDIDITGNSIVGRAGMPPKAFGERTFGFKAKFEAPLKF